MTTELLIITIFMVLVIAAIFFRKNPIVKLYWKYLVISAPLVLLMIINVITKLKDRSNEEDIPDNESLINRVRETRERLEESRVITSIEITAARTENEVVVKQLEEIKKEPDVMKRRKKLANLIN